jgi:Ca2+-binding RTX toxin-like protein
LFAGDESKYTIDYLGNKDNNTLTSTVTNKDEIFVAGAGNDTLTGNGGMDVFNAGVGDDSPALETERLLELSADSPLITKPPVPVAIADKLIAVLSCLPKMT